MITKYTEYIKEGVENDFKEVKINIYFNHYKYSNTLSCNIDYILPDKYNNVDTIYNLEYGIIQHIKSLLKLETLNDINDKIFNFLKFILISDIGYTNHLKTMFHMQTYELLIYKIHSVSDFKKYLTSRVKHLNDIIKDNTNIRIDIDHIMNSEFYKEDLNSIKEYLSKEMLEYIETLENAKNFDLL